MIRLLCSSLFSFFLFCLYRLSISIHLVPFDYIRFGRLTDTILTRYLYIFVSCLLKLLLLEAENKISFDLNTCCSYLVILRDFCALSLFSLSLYNYMQKITNRYSLFSILLNIVGISNLDNAR